MEQPVRAAGNGSPLDMLGLPAKPAAWPELFICQQGSSEQALTISNRRRESGRVASRIKYSLSD